MRTGTCPSCQANLQGEPIPEKDRKYYRNDTTHFSRAIGCDVRGVYDGVLYWYCPDCGHAWPRKFAHGPLRKLSVKYADLHNERVVSS